MKARVAFKGALAGTLYLAQFGRGAGRNSNVTLDGKRIVVLGGSSGIGLATAEAAAREGASVVIASSRKTRVDRQMPAKIADLTKPRFDIPRQLGWERSRWPL